MKKSHSSQEENTASCFKKIPSEIEVAPRYTLLTLFILFTLFTLFALFTLLILIVVWVYFN